MLEALDAKLPVFRRQRRTVGARQRHEGIEVRPLGQILGELETGARRRRVRVHAVVQQPEALSIAQLLVTSAHLRDLFLVEGETQRIERRTPEFPLGQSIAQNREGIRLLAWIGGALVSDIGGRRCALIEQGPLPVVGGADLENGFRQPQPVTAVLRRDRRGLAEQCQRAAQIATLEGGVRVGLQRRRRLVDDPRFGLDLRLEPHPGVGQIVPPERLVRRTGRRKAERQGGANRKGANQTDHSEAPCRRTQAVLKYRQCANRDGLMVVSITARNIPRDGVEPIGA